MTTTELPVSVPRLFFVALNIIHPSLDPDDISRELGLDPRNAHRVGAPRSTPTGQPLPGRYRDSRWRYQSSRGFKDDEVDDVIVELLNVLAPSRAFLRHMRSTGGRLSIILSFQGRGYVGSELPPNALAMMADLQLDLGIEFFSVPQSSAY